MYILDFYFLEDPPTGISITFDVGAYVSQSKRWSLQGLEWKSDNISWQWEANLWQQRPRYAAGSWLPIKPLDLKTTSRWNKTLEAWHTSATKHADNNFKPLPNQ